MRIAIIDADLIGRTKHRFPNLVCMKLSGYHKALGNEVELKMDYDSLETYDKVYISKVFTDTKIDESILQLHNVEYGGTGFFYDKAPSLPAEIEHHMPDYHLYDEWVFEQLENGGKRIDFKYYLDYSLGFLTRGCFRQCEFCVNKNYKKVEKHSPLTEFFDSTRKKICLLDDNFLGCSYWKEMLLELQNSGKQFQFKQGLDPEFEALYQPMFDNAERIAHYNNYKAINAIAGMVYEKHKALCHPYPTLMDKITKYGYDNKQLHHMLRCEEFMMRFINGTPYRECLISENKEHLINVKAKYIYSLEDAKVLARRKAAF